MLSVNSKAFGQLVSNACALIFSSASKIETEQSSWHEMEGPIKMTQDENSIDQIFNWIFNEFRQPDGTIKLSNLKVLKTHFENIVGEHGCVFKDDNHPTQEEEEGHYLYYYGAATSLKSLLGKATVKPFREKWSHEWIATALCVFATCVKYQEISSAEDTSSKISSSLLNRYVKAHSLEEQALKCKQFFESMTSPSGVFNLHGILSQHFSAYQCVFRDICKYYFGKEGAAKYISGNNTPRHQKRNGYQACLWFVKGFITSMTSGESRTTVSCYKAASKLQPKYYFWSWIRFLSGRKRRVDSAASQKLLRCVERAYEFSPETLDSRIGVALIVAGLQNARLIGDDGCRNATWTLLESARENLKNDPSELHRKWIALKLGELYITTGIGSEMTSDHVHHELKGKRLLDACLSLFPDCHLTISALAALREKGSPSGEYKNLHRARQLQRKKKKILCSAKKESSTIFQFHTKALSETSTNERKEWVYFLMSRESAYELECPPVWISDWIPELQSYTADKYESPTSYLKTLLSQRHDLGDQQEDTQKNKNRNSLPTKSSDVGSATGGNDEEILSEIFQKSQKWICDKLCNAALAHCIGNVRLFKEELHQCKLALDEGRLRARNNHYKVYGYLVEATRLHNDILKLKFASDSSSKEERLFGDQLAQARAKWLQVKGSPVIHFVKGRLAEMMGITPEISLDHYKKATQLEPQYHLWREMLWELQKQSQCFRSSSFNVPDAEEVQTGGMDPEFVKLKVAIRKLQILRRKLERSLEEYDASEETKVLEKMLRCLRERAVKGSKDEMLAKLMTAELYTLRGLPQLTSQAEKHFTELYKEWPNSAVVLHKVANFHHYSRPNQDDHRRAWKVYEEAMVAGPKNYPCLIDFLTLLGTKFLKKYKDMLAVIDKHIPNMKTPEHILDLLIIKGQANWMIRDIQAACASWVKAFIWFPQLAFVIKETLKSSSSPIFGRIDIPLEKVCPHFKKACENKKVFGIKALRDFIEVLEKAGKKKTTARSKVKSKTNAKKKSNNVPKVDKMEMKRQNF